MKQYTPKTCLVLKKIFFDNFQKKSQSVGPEKNIKKYKIHILFLKKYLKKLKFVILNNPASVTLIILEKNVLKNAYTYSENPH